MLKVGHVFMSQSNTQLFSAETDVSKEKLGKLMIAEVKVSLCLV